MRLLKPFTIDIILHRDVDGNAGSFPYNCSFVAIKWISRTPNTHPPKNLRKFKGCNFSVSSYLAMCRTNDFNNRSYQNVFRLEVSVHNSPRVYAKQAICDLPCPLELHGFRDKRLLPETKDFVRQASCAFFEDQDHIFFMKWYAMKLHNVTVAV